MSINSAPLGIKLDNKTLINSTPIRISGWRPPKTSKKKSRPNSSRPKRTFNRVKNLIAGLLQPIVRGFLDRQFYKKLLNSITIVYPKKKKNKRLQLLGL